MKIILMGMPGSGKGTVSKYLCQKYHFQHISTGDLLRAEVMKKTALGQKVEKIMDSGKLVSDDLTIDLIRKKIEGQDFDCIFDGFPRTLDQAIALNAIVQIDYIVFLRVDENVAMERIRNRMAKEIFKRSDDNDKVILERIRIYYENTQPLFDYYHQQKKLKNIDAFCSVEQVLKNVEMELDLS